MRQDAPKTCNAPADLRASRADVDGVAAAPVRLDRFDLKLHSSERAVPAVFDRGGNVVPFAPMRGAGKTPALVAAANDRLVRPLAGHRGRVRFAALLMASLLAHGAIYAAFDQAPPPLTSIGEVAISVEIVLGSEHAAGLAETPSETEAPESAASAASPQVAAATPAEDPPVPAEPKLASAVETPPPKPTPPVENKVEEPKPVEQAKPPETKTEPAVAELALEEPKPIEQKPAEVKTAQILPPEREPVKPPEPVKASEPVAAAPEKPAELPPPLPSDRSKELPSRASTASVASTSSSGVGRGRSDVDSNYRGVVAAHLARHKRFPEEIRRRRQQGSTVVTFAIDGNGKVTTITIARSSGNSNIDEASQEMIRRASPFPPPPNRQAMSFSVPVSFEIR